MANNGIDLLKLLKDKKLSDEFVNSLNKAFIGSVSNDIKNTISRYIGHGGSTIEELKGRNGEDDWFYTTLYSLIYSTNSVSKFQNTIISKAISPDKQGRFIESFEENATASVNYATSGREGIPNAIELEVSLDVKGTNLEAQELARGLFTVAHGGEWEPSKEFANEDNEGPIVVNALPGYNETLMQAAADRVRDYYIKNYDKKLNDSLKKEIEEKLKSALK